MELVIKVNCELSIKSMMDIRNQIIKQKKEGVIVLPSFCEAIVVPNGIDIRDENEAPETDCCKWFYGVFNNKWYRTLCGMYYDRKSKITAKNIKKGVCPYCKRKIQIIERNVKIND